METPKPAGMETPKLTGTAHDPRLAPVWARTWRALMALEMSSKLALVCIVFGWFFMTALEVSLGSLQHGVRFIDMSAVIADPTRLFFGGNTPVHRIVFGLVCLVGLAAPLAAQLLERRAGSLAYLAPLALMLACAGLLYYRTSGELIAAPDDSASLTGSLMHLANTLAHRGTDLVSRHVSVAAGSYLAVIGCLVLAYQGLQRFLRSAAMG